MTDTPGLNANLDNLRRSIWTAAALAARGRTADAELAKAVEDVVVASGYADHAIPAELAAGIQSQLQRAAQLAAGARPSWGELCDSVLIGQGRASALGGAAMAEQLVPRLPGLSDALAREGASFLDVGVGVGALSCAFLERMPHVGSVGLDVLPRALELARTTVDEAGMSGRVELRLADVADLGDTDRFDLAWLPVPFVPQRAVDAAIPRLLSALRPGGWLVAATDSEPGDALADALSRLHGVLTGGSGMAPSALCARLRDTGFVDVATFPRPEAGPTITVGRRPPG